MSSNSTPDADPCLDPTDTLIANGSDEFCAVCGKETASDHWVARFEVKGRRVRVCCPLCAETFQTDPDKYVARLSRIGYYRELLASRKESTAPRKP